MAGRYAKQNWQSGTVLPPYGPISGARLQKLDDAMAVIYDDYDAHLVPTGNPHTQYFLKPTSPGADTVWAYTGGVWQPVKVTAAMIAAAAGIAKSQLAPLGIVDADVTGPISASKISGAAAVPPGVIVEFGGDVAPAGWVLCDGAAYDGTNALYTPLWNAIGTRHGGTGQSNFLVPDSRGRVTVGKGTHSEVDTVGKNDGVALASRRPKHAHPHSLTLPNHGHAVGDPGHAHASARQGAGLWVDGGSAVQINNNGSTNAAGTGISVGNPTSNPTIDGAIGQVGVNDAPAYLVVTRIIKL